MILTTNRVQTIDSAFKSRIHLSLTYPNLSVEARSKIWETFILKGTSQQRPHWLDAKFLQTIASEDINGREIKNMVRVAHALAVNDKRSMSKEDILQGLQYLKDFERDFSEAGKKRKGVVTEQNDFAKRVRLDNQMRYENEQEKERVINEQMEQGVVYKEGRHDED